MEYPRILPYKFKYIAPSIDHSLLIPNLPSKTQDSYEV